MGGSAGRVWEGVCAVLCQCLHDAMGGHKMDILGDTYLVGERRSRGRCAKVRGFAAPSRPATVWILFLLSFMSTLRLWNKFKRFEVGDQISESMIFNILKKTPS